MNLASAPLREVVTVDRVGGDRGFRRRLMELGLVPGTRVQVVGVAPLGDPLELLVRGCSLSIRRSEAVNISIRTRESCCFTDTDVCRACAAQMARGTPADERTADAA